MLCLDVRAKSLSYLVLKIVLFIYIETDAVN